MPQRIQRRRIKGWRMPEGAVYVGRGSKWGNPFGPLGTNLALARVPAAIHAGRDWEFEDRISADGMLHPYFHPDGRITDCQSRYLTAAESVECYRAYLAGGGWPLNWTPREAAELRSALPDLAGRDISLLVPARRRARGSVPVPCRRAARPRESGCAMTPPHAIARKHRNQLWERRK